MEPADIRKLHTGLVSYDLDGVIAEKKEIKKDKSWGKMNGLERKTYLHSTLHSYATSTVILRPIERYIIVTARKEDKEVVETTLHWLRQNKISPVGIFFLNKPRSITNVGKFKANVVTSLNAECHIEDNKKVLQEMKKYLPKNFPLYYFDGHTISLYS